MPGKSVLTLLLLIGIGEQRGRGSGALAQDIGRTKFPFLGSHVVGAVKRVGAVLMELAETEIAEV